MTVSSIVQEPVTMLHHKSKDTTQRELSLQTLKLRVIFGYLDGPNAFIFAFKIGIWRQRQVRFEVWKDSAVLALKTEDGATSQGM